MSNTKKQLELYIHIPFCVRKCAYCDFLSAPATEETKAIYVEALIGEIKTKRADGHLVTSVFFGGGTPSILPAGDLARILEAAKEQFTFAEDCEITAECNPGTLTEEKLASYKAAGINRLSIGLQSADNRELKLLGRIHTWEQFLESYHLARQMGFANINIDLMSALPGQTRESYQRTLEEVCALQPEHISAYSLIIEEGTPFFEMYGDSSCDRTVLPDEDTERQMYYDTKEILAAHGYHRYEISNYAKEGYECRHNVGYWVRRDYLGLGLGSSSLMENVRFKNKSDLNAYLAGDYSREEETILSDEDVLAEIPILGLRMTEGILYTEELKEAYDSIVKKYCEMGFLQIGRDGYLSFTDCGLDVSNVILSEFI